jgi:hypothetical protein
MLLSVTDFQEFGADGQCCISLISGEIRFGKKRNCINRFECKPVLFASQRLRQRLRSVLIGKRYFVSRIWYDNLVLAYC